MTLLTQLLDRLSLWIQSKYPDGINLLNDGLTRDQITEKVKSLPFQFPEELYELYQWRNGQKYGSKGAMKIINFKGFGYDIDLEVFDCRIFLPLEDAIERYSFELHGYIFSDPSPRFKYSWFPVFYRDSYNYLLFDIRESGTCPLVSMRIQSLPEEALITYSSLTKMIMTLVEFYESGGDEIGVDEFCDQFEEIWLQHNADIIAEDFSQSLKDGRNGRPFSLYYNPNEEF
jgi:hypothetical protein